ncbi:MAG: UPF0104 family protein [Calditrichaeota bacterium]|nr:MAG: UPF0104 family protein [Calditrichota bacterium]MBL1207579.1 UPF0104 family protein [Calditrichota bacterium]NOG47411.1 flippase-like domain-containing protein [Calditrichota bacterium]
MRHFKTIAKAIISIGLFTYLFATADQKQIVHVLGNVYRADGLAYLFLAFFAYFCSIGLMAFRWKIILKHYDLDFSFKKLFGYYLVGLFFNNFLPSSIGGDIIRIYKVVGNSEDRSPGFASVILERILGVASTLFLAIISLYYVSHYFQDDRILYTSAALFSLIVVFFVLITRNRPFEFLLKVFDKFSILNIGEKINKLIEAIHFLKEKKQVFIWVFLLSLLSQVAIVFLNYAVVLALDIDVDLTYLFLVVPVTFIITMLPSINGVGVREYGFVFFLAAVNVSSAAAISLSVMNVLVPMFISIWGGLLFLMQRKNSKIDEVKAIEKNL